MVGGFGGLLQFVVGLLEQIFRPGGVAFHVPLVGLLGGGDLLEGLFGEALCGSDVRVPFAGYVFDGTALGDQRFASNQGYRDEAESEP